MGVQAHTPPAVIQISSKRMNNSLEETKSVKRLDNESQEQRDIETAAILRQRKIGELRQNKRDEYQFLTHVEARRAPNDGWRCSHP